MQYKPLENQEATASLALTDIEALEVINEITRQLLNHEPVEIFIFDAAAD